jgi:hypothetical protein
MSPNKRQRASWELYDEWRDERRRRHKPKPLTPLEKAVKWLDAELRTCGVTS